MNSIFKVLIIDPSSSNQNDLTTLMDNLGYQSQAVSNTNEGLQLIVKNYYDLIICQNEFENTSALELFVKIKKYLMTNGSAFFILMNKFENEDIIIGLELGVDNFLLCPIDETSLLNKIENHITKTRDIGIFKVKQFRTFFNFSPIAMFELENNKIIGGNTAFYELFGFNHRDKLQIDINEVFDITADKLNLFNLRKLETGLIDYCLLDNVVAYRQPGNYYELALFGSSNLETGKILAEVVPMQNLSARQAEFRDRENRKYEISQIINSGKRKANINITKRESEVIMLSSRGLPIKQIAAKLNLSERTVEKHRSNIMRKTGSKNIIEAIITVENSEIPRLSELVKLN